MTHDDLLTHLHREGLIRTRDASITPLTGGVSSEILLIDDGEKKFVLKRALAKLKVKDDWYADVSRNRYEQEYLKYVGAFLPDAVPKVLHSDPEHGFFTMEYLGEGFANWKKLLLEGRAEMVHAESAGHTLGSIHRRTWGDATARRRFDTYANFYQLRVEPYLLTTGQRHPKLQPLFEAEAERLSHSRVCLVHGDFSPKNILIGPEGRMVVLDCEVAWFGDPAFDVAFLFSHFLLKSLFLRYRDGIMAQSIVGNLAYPAWFKYRDQLTREQWDDLEPHITRLLLMLLLARIDGKSPVEYLTEEDQKDFVRRFVNEILPRYHADFAWLLMEWLTRLDGP